MTDSIRLPCRYGYLYQTGHSGHATWTKTATYCHMTRWRRAATSGGCACSAQKTAVMNTPETITAHGVPLAIRGRCCWCSLQMWALHTVRWTAGHASWKRVCRLHPAPYGGQTPCTESCPDRQLRRGCHMYSSADRPAAARQAPQRILRIKIYDRYCRLRDSSYQDKSRANK